GCLLAAAGAGAGAGMMYVKGKSTDVLEASPRAVAEATEMAMKDLGIAVISRQASDVDASIVGLTATDAKVDVTVKSETQTMSKIFIRVGVWGDDVLQWRLLKQIRTNLGLPASPTTNTS